MYLSSLHIKNFRAIEGCTFNFHEGVNILIGANNSGKSAVVDALRLCFMYGEPWRSIRVREEDFFIDRSAPGKPTPPIEFDLTFLPSEKDEDGIFGDMLVVKEDGSKEFQLHFRYARVYTNDRFRADLTMWGGEKEGHPVDRGTFAYFESVYLEALRDAVSHLKPSATSRLGEMYASIVDSDEQEELTEDIHQSLHGSARWQGVIEDGKNKLTGHVQKSMINGEADNFHIGFLPYEFRQLVNSLKMQMMAYDPAKLSKGQDQVYLSLYQNGLGSNNIIYTSAVLGDLEKKKENHPDAFFSLLIEEPEAHLHPQLQSRFFGYLSSLNDIGIQIFITSHSPTITAKSPLDSLIVLQKVGHKVNSLSLKNSNLDATDKAYLHKFLDVTKSQMLFAKAVIFVEGISETLLLPELARSIAPKYDLLLNGIEVVNVNGVSFEHFAKLFNSTTGGLMARASILTDKDNESGAVSSRANNAAGLAGHHLKVHLAEITFEYELFMKGSNEVAIMTIMHDLHPQITTEINGLASKEAKANRFVKALNDNSTKSEFAHRLSVGLSDEENPLSISCPDYISSALKWIVDGT